MELFAVPLKLYAVTDNVAGERTLTECVEEALAGARPSCS